MPNLTNRKSARATGARTYIGRPCSFGHIERSVEYRYCMQCRRDKAARERSTDPEIVRERTRVWRSKNPDWRSNYRRANLSRYAVHASARRARQMKRTPKWSTPICISALYRIADSLRSAGVDVQVDHIVPLKGATVSGLHVRKNLQLLPSIENQRKNNRFIEGAR